MSNVGHDFLESVRQRFRQQKKTGDAALRQLAPEDFHWRPDAGSNTVAIIVRHLSGNMLSRWTDFLTSDGEKPTRDRDGEFETVEATPDQLLAQWEEGWQCLLRAVDALNVDDLAKTVLVRGEPLGVIDATLRQLAHAASHVGQIIWIAKSRRGSAWKTLSIPRGQSRNEQLIRSLELGFRENPERPV